MEPLTGRDPDDSMGALLRNRFGDEVHDQLVGASIGTIFAADTGRSAWPWSPGWRAAGRARAVSLLLSRPASARRGPCCDRPCLPRPDIAEWARSGRRGCRRGASRRGDGPDLGTGRRAGPGRLSVKRVDGEMAGAVVLATPAAPTAPLLTAAGGARGLGGCWGRWTTRGWPWIRLAVQACPTVPRRFSGYLIPKPDQVDNHGGVVRVTKWAHWRGVAAVEILRVSMGRDGLPIDDVDDGVLLDTCAVSRLGHHLGVDLQPTSHPGHRWPASFPPLPAAPSRVAAPRSMPPFRRGCSSPGRATAGSVCRRASPTPGDRPRRRSPP